ncbi:MAG: hypothetical protein HY537_05430 [Deltaproteobacteria bacterium]|nr:hypothetical protein [Deltaproteobacteria bacterium]
MDALIALCEECIALNDDLKNCLRTERDCLVRFAMDELIQNNLLKETLLKKLVAKKQALKDALAQNSNRPKDFENHLEKWSCSWKELKGLCEANAGFLSHSMRNLNLMAEHLKSAFGEQTIYSSKGIRKELRSCGRVVEARL